MCCVAEAGVCVCKWNNRTASMFMKKPDGEQRAAAPNLHLWSTADSEATRSCLPIPRAANLRLRSSADSAAVLHLWRGVTEHFGTLPLTRWDSVSDARSRFGRCHLPHSRHWRTRSAWGRTPQDSLALLARCCSLLHSLLLAIYD